MPEFRNLSEIEKYLKENPSVALKQNIGNTVKYECPVCKTIEKIEIVSESKVKCSKCNNEFNVELVVE